MSVVLEATNIYQEFEGEVLFEPFSFSVKDHDRIALLGQNGSGKTLFLSNILHTTSAFLDRKYNKMIALNEYINS